MLEYKGSKIIKIDSIALIGPDMRQYITTSPSIPFVLDSTNSTKELEMQFKPEHIGRAMTQIAYYFNSFASPLYSVLTGEGVLPCSSDVPDYSDFRSIDNLKFVGNASRLNNIIRLTPAAKFQAGGLWYKYALPAANGFEAKFSFRLSGGYNDFNEGSAAGADGLAFVIQSTGSYTLGENGGGIGYAGIKNCIAVEFDTYLDDLDFRDANGAHIAVFCNPKDFTKGEHQSRQLLGEKTSKYPFKALWNKYYCTIDYNLIPGKLRIFFDSSGFTNKSFLEIDSLQLENLIELIGGNSAYFGFTASTGSSYEAHDLLSFSLCVFGSKITSEVELQPDNTGSLLVSPLPASDFIKISNIPPNCYKLTVCDIFGNVIEQFDSPNQSTILIGLNGYSTGVFIIKANCGSEIVIGKAVVAR
ncbi:MAG: hypothetical protein QG635_561 [Bacteroidota bacterium]|nr:hypothetical protein [Bacteroidota bacterium]